MALLSDLKVAIFAGHGVNQTELVVPREYLEKAGIVVEVVSNFSSEVKAWHEGDWGIRIKVDRQINDVLPDEYQGMIIPGGIFHSDEMRMDEGIQDFVRQQFSSGRTVAAVSHGVQVLISSHVLDGRKVTSCTSIKKDVHNAKAIWSDEEVVSDNGLITCRSVHEIENFTNALLDDLRRGIHQRTETII